MCGGSHNNNNLICGYKRAEGNDVDFAETRLGASHVAPREHRYAGNGTQVDSHESKNAGYTLEYFTDG